MKFIREQSLDRLDIAPQEKPIAVHVTCSAQHLGGAQGVIDIVRRCTTAPLQWSPPKVFIAAVLLATKALPPQR